MASGQSTLNDSRVHVEWKSGLGSRLVVKNDVFSWIKFLIESKLAPVSVVLLNFEEAEFGLGI